MIAECYLDSPRVIIVGAGMSSIALAIRLKQDLHLETFTIYERAKEEGGTWRDNTYPGCTCDIPSHWYSLSTDLNPDWTQKYASQGEIKAYWKRIFAKNDLAKYAKFNRTFKTAEWDEAAAVWNVVFYNTLNPSETFEDQAEFLVSAAGGLSNPSFQKQSLKGLEDFQGNAFHSAQWDHSVSLSDKRVALIGNGCSAAQILPVISKDQSMQITNFMRTPSWMSPRDQFSYSDRRKWIFRNIPLVMRAYRNWMIFFGDLRWLGWTKHGAAVRKTVEKTLIARMKHIAPAKYHEILTPNYPLGCKRVILDPGYYDSLNKTNVHLVADKIDTFTKKGILTVDGTEREFDIIILATGFDLSSESTGLDIKSNGKTLVDVWNSKGGPQAYLGTSNAFFPNFVSLLGPNVASGHYSVLSSSEMQITMIINLLRPLLENGVQSLVIKEEEEDRYSDEIQSRLNNTVFSQCSSWYRNGSTGKIHAAKPGFYFEYWWRTRSTDFSKYIQKGGKSLADSQHTWLPQSSLIVAGLCVAAGLYRSL